MMSVEKNLNAELKPIKYLSNCRFGPNNFVTQISITAVQMGSTQTQALQALSWGCGGSRRWWMAGTSGRGHFWTMHPWENTPIIRSRCKDHHLLLRLCLQDKQLGAQDPYATPKRHFVFLPLLASSALHFLPLLIHHLFYFNLRCYSSLQDKAWGMSKRPCPRST